MKRSYSFYLNFHDVVISREEEADVELNSDAIGMIPNPWFRQCYRTIIDY